MSFTKQQTFDIIVSGARKQGCKSRTVDGCLYRGPNGTKCFIGMLIPDDKYDPDMEGSIPMKGSEIYNVLNELGHDMVFCDKIQDIHDCCNVEEWEERFEDIADDYELVYTPVACDGDSNG